ncbi:unnamed protein product [Phytomonas sp. Hart1]|nr:unnamed protein product [Phytomonas sp. Hart1]|eukprot:CCW71478.1 unnamed protein product [Phytomonas sp. isolate Hart1]
MSSIFSVLHRSERLLPVDSEDILNASNQYTVLCVDSQKLPKLYEHVNMYWQEYKQRHGSNCMIPSTRVPVRSTNFPEVTGLHKDATEEADTDPHSPFVSTSQPPTSGPSAPTPSIPAPSLSPSFVEADALRFTACARAVRLLSPYERLMCPTLLFSPLYALHPPSVDEATPTSMALTAIYQVTQVAVSRCLPVQEALLFFSLSLVYLEAVLTINPDDAPFPEGEAANGAEAPEKPPRTLVDLSRRLRAVVGGFGLAPGPTSSGRVPASNGTLELLRLAAEEWYARRTQSVSLGNPFGDRAVALATRDLLRIAAWRLPIEDEKASDSRRGGTWGRKNNPGGGGGGERGALFEPYEPRDKPQKAHAFHLPPLPQDPILSFFVPTWQRVLTGCVRDLTWLRELRSVLMTEAGKQCEALIHGSPTAGCPALPTSSSSTSFVVYGPMDRKLRCNHAAGWYGFEGALLRCGAWIRTGGPSAPSGSPITFQDPALGLNSTAREASPELFATAEELADLVNRLGIVLKGGDLTVLTLPRQEAHLALRAMRSDLLDAYLACKRGGLQELRLRATTDGLVLAYIRDNGSEVKIGTPAQIVAAGAERRRPPECQKNGDPSPLHLGGRPALLLQRVWEGGYEEAATLLRSACGRHKTASWIPLGPSLLRDPFREGEDGPCEALAVNRAGQKGPPSVRAYSLLRAEESALLRVLSCHPYYYHIIGCGVRKLAVRDPDAQLLVQRVCGLVVELQLRDCYSGAHLETLRTPMQIGFTSKDYRPMSPLLRATDSSSKGAGWSKLQTIREHVHGMLNHYYTALKQETTSRKRKRERQEADPHHETLKEANKPAITLGAEGGRGDRALDFDHAEPFTLRTHLFEVDRATIFYVVRHHPRYYSQIRGCGIREIYISTKSTSKAPTTSWACDAADCPAEGGPLESRRGWITRNARHRAGDAAGDSGESKGIMHHPSPDANGRITEVPTFVIERACGRLVEVDFEECYSNEPPFRLHQRQIIVKGPLNQTKQSNTRQTQSNIR